MTIKSHTQKDGTVWEWEETPDLKQWISLQLARKGMIQYEGAIKELAEK